MRKRSASHPDDGGNEQQTASLRPETDQALRRRGRSITWRGATSTAGVLFGDYLLGLLSHGDDAVAAVLALIVFALFVRLISAIWAWFGFVQVRRVLRRHPWLEWYGRDDTLRVAGVGVAHVIVLAHPGWPDEEVRTLHPLRAASSLALGDGGSVWAAGVPARTLVVSAEGGGAPLHALRPPFASLRSRLIAFVQKSAEP